MSRRFMWSGAPTRPTIRSWPWSKAGDIVVTQDYGLATILLNKAIVLHHMGWRYRPEAMDQLLTQRYMGQVSRRKTGRYGGKGPKPFGRQDRERFSASLEAIIRQEKQEEKGAGL